MTGHGVDAAYGHVRGEGRTDLLLPWLRAGVDGRAHPVATRLEAARVRAAARYTVAHHDPTQS